MSKFLIKHQKSIDINPLVLKEIIDSTLFAVSQDELKPALTGVFKFQRQLYCRFYRWAQLVNTKKDFLPRN